MDRAERDSDVESLQEHALDNLRFIRNTMEGASSFTAVPGWGGVFIGLTALFAGAAAWNATGSRWLALWLGEAALAVVIGGTTMVLKARAAGVPIAHGAGRRFMLSYIPPLLVAVALTAAFIARGDLALLPAMWLLLYGTAVTTGGAFAVRPVPLMGIAFVILGGVALVTPRSADNVLLMAGFGGLHIAFGAWIARKHGG